jgi:DNA helicase-2/ATP-dependent DNA helicase PcrA
MYEQIKVDNSFSGKTYDAFDRFIRLIESTKTLMGQKPLIEILEKMENDSGLRAMYEAAHEVDRLENIKELINDVITFQNQYPESGLDEYLQMVALYGDRNDLTDGDYCQMMTIHAAKGLEFDTVFVIGLSEGIFPNERAMSEGRRGLEEERRLAYVAYTRAKNKLFLTEVSGYSFVLTKIRSRSRFIEEVDQKHIDHIGVNYDFEKPKEMNIKSKPKEQSLFADSMEKRKALPYKKGELIQHSTFGEGVIMKIDGGMAEIAFDYPHGVKKIMLAAPAISKVKREDV